MGEFDLTLGPILLGTMFATLLLGVMIVQSYNYFSNCCGDRLWIKITVSFLLGIDCLSTAFDIYWSYSYFVTNFGNNQATESVNNVAALSWPVLTGITAYVVQCVFAWRIHILIRQRLLTIIIACLSVAQLLLSIATTIGAHLASEFSNLKMLTPIALSWMVTSAVADVIITVALAWYLRKNKTGMQFTDNFIDKLVRLTIQTGLLTTTFSVIIVVLNLTEPSAAGLIFGLPLSKIYTTSLLSTMNARKTWDKEYPSTVQLGTVSFATHTLAQGIQIEQSSAVFSSSETREVQLTTDNPRRSGEIEKKTPYTVV